MNISQIVFNVDAKPMLKAIKHLEYMYKKVQEYNELVTNTNSNIERYLKLKRQANVENSKDYKNDKKS